MFVNQSARFGVGVCCRGYGKSYLAGACASTAVFELMHLPRGVPHKWVAIIAPTYDQVTDIYYPLLADQIGLSKYAIKSSRDAGRFWFPNNVELHLISYEAVERMRGKGYYFVVADEVVSWTKGVGLQEAWQANVCSRI